MSDDDINLGRKLYRAMKEEKEYKEKVVMTSKLAKGFVVLVIVVGIISCMLVGGPK